jgi:uncharacterized membrane protein
VLVISNNYYYSSCIILIVKLVIVAGLRLGLAYVLYKSIELLIIVLIKLFIIITSDSRSRLWFNL